jgi:hypothetical protein
MVLGPGVQIIKVWTAAASPGSGYAGIEAHWAGAGAPALRETLTERARLNGWFRP